MIGLPHKRYVEAVKRIFKSEDLVPPGFIIELDRPEWSFLKRERLFAGTTGANGPGVGNFSRFQLINPANSQLLVTVEKIWCVTFVGADTFTVRLGGGLLAGAAGAVSRDRREPQGAHSQLSVQSAAVGAGAEVERLSLSIVGTITTQVAYILSPGSAVEVDSTTLNQTSLVGFTWRERHAEPEELAD